MLEHLVPSLTLTRAIAFSASLDAGNRHRKLHGRTAWSIEDQSAATTEFQRLWPRCTHNIEPEDWCFFCDKENKIQI